MHKFLLFDTKLDVLIYVYYNCHNVNVIFYRKNINMRPQVRSDRFVVIYVDHNEKSVDHNEEIVDHNEIFVLNTPSEHVF